MAKVRFEDQGVEVDVPVGTSILQASKLAHAPEGDACGGVCACSTCHVYVEVGAELLSEASENEEDILDKAFDVRINSRLGCQAKLQRDGLVVVRISRESLAAYANEHPDG
jgi:ferredoxin, 2Fe-2S